MDVRNATSTDAELIKPVARASLSESYGQFIDQETIAAIVEEWYGEQRLDELLDEENELFLLGFEGETLVGFVQGALLQEEPLAGEIDWLHVAPQFRGQDVGARLLGQFQDTVEDLGATVCRGKVLAGNQDGAAFYEEHGFERVDSRDISFSGDTYEELVYENPLGEGPTEEVVESITGPDGEDLYVSYSSGERGASGLFYTIFLDDELAEKYGYFCGNCESLATAMDAMGRIECTNCGNKRKATRWDAAYL